MGFETSKPIPNDTLYPTKQHLPPLLKPYWLYKTIHLIYTIHINVKKDTQIYDPDLKANNNNNKKNLVLLVCDKVAILFTNLA